MKIDYQSAYAVYLSGMQRNLRGRVGTTNMANKPHFGYMLEFRGTPIYRGIGLIYDIDGDLDPVLASAIKKYRGHIGHGRRNNHPNLSIQAAYDLDPNGITLHVLGTYSTRRAALDAENGDIQVIDLVNTVGRPGGRRKPAPRHRLTEADVHEIERLLAAKQLTQNEISIQFGCSQPTVHMIAHRKHRFSTPVTGK